MKGVTIGTLISAVGYSLAIWGGWILHRNATPDHGYGTIPSFSGTNEMMAFQKKQQKDIEARAHANPFGFLLLTIGALLQLVGTLISGFSG